METFKKRLGGCAYVKGRRLQIDEITRVQAWISLCLSILEKVTSHWPGVSFQKSLREQKTSQKADATASSWTFYTGAFQSSCQCLSVSALAGVH